MKRMTVFCGASSGTGSIYRDAAMAMGEALVSRKMNLVFGGGMVGLMGIVADAVLDGGGKVTGVIPTFLAKKEIAHEGLSELIVVDTMHTRKMKMHEISDAAIAMPGGYGTLDELFEMLTWSQLGVHRKPIGLFNVNGYFDHLIAFIDHMQQEDFIQADTRSLLVHDEDPDRLLEKMANYIPPALPAWLNNAGI